VCRNNFKQFYVYILKDNFKQFDTENVFANAAEPAIIMFSQEPLTSLPTCTSRIEVTDFEIIKMCFVSAVTLAQSVNNQSFWMDRLRVDSSQVSGYLYLVLVWISFALANTIMIILLNYVA
jgi:hypothetical protein